MFKFQIDVCVSTTYSEIFCSHHVYEEGELVATIVIINSDEENEKDDLI